MRQDEERRFEEGTLCFEFGPSWECVVKYDACSAYTHGIGKLQGSLKNVPVGTKGVDFVALRKGHLYFLEINDFRGHRIASKDSRGGEVWLEIGLKVRDTLAGLLGAHSKEDDTLGTSFAPVLLKPGQLTVISWMEQDLPSKDWKMWSSLQRKELKRRLHWLNARCDVINQNVGDLPDVAVINLSHS